MAKIISYLMLIYASVAARFAHSWKHVTITRDDVLRDAGQQQEHFWTKATWLTCESMKEC